jgi:transcriptional regulator with XRE-family HTH domain
VADKLSRSLGRRIHQLRSSLGLSQEALAERSGLHRTYVGGVERGERNPTVKNLSAISRALKVSLSTLFEGVEQ